MGLVSTRRLEGYEDLGSTSFIKSRNFILFGGVWVVYFTNGYLRFGFLEQLYGFCCCDSKVFPLHLNSFDICECGHVLVACEVFGKLPLYVRGSNFLTCVMMTVI